MIFLKELEIISDVIPLKAGMKLSFSKSICFLLGDNGTGKSTLLDCMADHLGHEDKSYLKRRKLGEHVKMKVKKGVGSVYLDLHQSDHKFSSSFGDDIALQIHQMKASSGQTTLLSLLKIDPTKIVDKIIILDEPCRGLSVRNQWVVSQMLRQMAERGNQVIVVTHSTLIMRELKPLAQFYDVVSGRNVDYDLHLSEQMAARPHVPVGTPPRRGSAKKTVLKKEKSKRA